MAIYFHPGRYRARIDKQAVVENKKGNPEVQLTIVILGRYANDTEVIPCTEGYQRTVFMTLSPLTIGTETKPGWVLQTLQSLGFNAQSFGQLDPAHEQACDLTGQEVDAVCQTNSYNGQDREKWSVRRPGGGGNAPGKPLERKGLKALDTKYGKVLKAVNKNAPPPADDANPDTPPGEDKPTPTEANIPF